MKTYPTKLEQVGDYDLKIYWSDDVETVYSVRKIRMACKCANCVDEWTREPKLKDEDIPQDIKPIKIDSVGRYALTFTWTDGHNTGIYTFDHLRSLAN